MNQYIHDIGSIVHPSSEFVRTALQEKNPAISGMYLIPTGGESYGVITASSLPIDAVDSLPEALIAMWKLVTCIVCGWPYESWDDETAWQVVQNFYSKDYNAWLTCRQEAPDSFVKYLVQSSRETVRVQHELTHPLNSPEYYPNSSRVRSDGLEELAFVTPENLKLILQTEWNEHEGVFQSQSRWFYLSWGTSA